MTGLDTGFFVRLLQQREEAWQVWDGIARGEADGAISCITLYELEKQGLKGAVSRRAAETLAAELPWVCTVVWVDGPELLRDAARVAHGNGLSMADALILASLIEVGVDRVYTTDEDLTRYRAGPDIVLI